VFTWCSGWGLHWREVTWPLTIVGAVRDRLACLRRGRGRDCAPAALDRGLLGGPSTSPLDAGSERQHLGFVPMFSSEFFRKYARIITVAARIFGIWSILVGTFFLLSAWASTSNRVPNVLVGLLAIAIGVGMLVARPVTVEQVQSIGKSMRNDQE